MWPEEPTRSRPFQILLVDDEDVDRLSVRRCLRQSGILANVDEAASEAEVTERMDVAAYDCVLLDYYLPGSDGIVRLKRIRDAAPHTPVVIFTGRGDEGIAVELMRAGAADYMPKASLTPERMASSLRHAIRLAEAAAARERAEQELRESEERLRRAFAIETVGIIFFTTDGEITYADDAFLRMSGYSREDVTAGRVRWDQLTPPEWMPQSLRAAEEFLATGQTTPYEKQYIRKDGSRWWGLLAATRLSEREGVEFVLDVTAEKRAEEQLARLLWRERAARADVQAALQARDTFFSSVTHDLRNPLGVVKGFAQLLKRRLAQASPPAADWLIHGLDQIEANADKTAALVSEILDLARYYDSGRLELQRETFDLVVLCQAVVAQQRLTTDRHELSFNTPGRQLVGTWDRGRLERVIGNLVGNAIKYSPDGGRILIRLDREPGKAGEEAVIAIQDQGVGIPAEDVPHIF
jgi:PAS domain S-box-containing protein